MMEMQQYHSACSELEAAAGSGLNFPRLTLPHGTDAGWSFDFTGCIAFIQPSTHEALSCRGSLLFFLF